MKNASFEELGRIADAVSEALMVDEYFTDVSDLLYDEVDDIFEDLEGGE